MKKFKSYTAKKYKIWRRILFFAVIAVLIFAFTVILGNVLKHRLDTTDISTEDITSVTDADTAPADDEQSTVSHDEALKSVLAACLDLSDAEDAAAARSVIDELRAEGYNAVSFVVRDEDGMVTYASAALQNYSKLKASSELIPVSVLSAAAVYARDRGMLCSAVFSIKDPEHDSIIAAELAELGFNDILIRGFEDVTALDNKTVNDIKAYSDAVRGDTDAICGISLCAEALQTAQNAPYIEKLYNMCEYLAINMTDADGETAGNICSGLQGSFSMYMLRPVLKGDNKELLDAVRAVLVESGVGTRQYVSWPPKPVDDGSDTTAAADDR